MPCTNILTYLLTYLPNSTVSSDDTYSILPICNEAAGAGSAVIVYCVKDFKIVSKRRGIELTCLSLVFNEITKLFMCIIFKNFIF